MDKLRIRLLGGLEITGSCDAGTIVLSRKSKAIVAYLALQHGRLQSREKLAALLWQDSPEEQARTNLRQTLSSIRKVLNGYKAADLVTDRNQISLTGQDIDLDVTEFEQLVAEATPDALTKAAALYKGDLLDGFSLKEDSFETWARAERERLRHLACNALIKLTTHYDEVGDTERCVATAARLLTLDPLREAAHRILMHAYAAQGRHASALKQFEACRDILKRELGVEPEPETVALYHDIRTHRALALKGDLATAKKPEADGPPLRNGPSLSTEHFTTVIPTAERTLRWPWVAAGLTVLVITAGVALWQRPWERSIEPVSVERMAFPLPERPSIAVLPFDNLSGEPEQELFANGMADDLITDLSKVTGLFVIARNSTFVYKNKPVEIRQVAEDLGVRYVMEGSVRRAGDTVRINAQLIDATTGGYVWADRFDGAVDDIFGIQDKFVREIIDALAVNLLPDDAEQIGQGQTDQVSAREAFQKGWELYLRFTPEDNVTALEHVEAAVELDPEYGRAYALLALIYLNIDNWSWYGSVGLGTSWMSYKFNMSKVETYLDLAKRYPTALAHVAGSRYAIANRDDHALALEEAGEAIALDPNEPEAHIAMAWALITTNEPAVGLKFVETAFRLNPRPPAHYFLAHGFAYFALSELDKAAEIFKAGSDLYPDALDLAGPLASTYALLGRREDAHQALLRWKGEKTQRGLEALLDKYFFPYRWPSDDRKVYDRYWDGLYAATLPPETTVPDLIHTVQHGDVFGRLLAIKSLGRLGEIAIEAVPALITSLGDEEQSIRKEAAIALGKIGPAAKEAIPALEALKDQIIVGTYAKEALKSIKGN